jgi:hypothetical protein
VYRLHSPGGGGVEHATGRVSLLLDEEEKNKAKQADITICVQHIVIA